MQGSDGLARSGALLYLFKNNSFLEAEAVATQLRALILVEDIGLVLSVHAVAHRHL